jgi:hypothetical protein
MKLSVIYPYYNNRMMFIHHLGQWERMHPHVSKHIEFIIVDDCSKRCPLEDDFKNFDPEHINISGYRILDDILWNVGGAKNLGAQQAKGEWLLITDMDRMIPEHVLYSCILDLNKPGHYYQFRQMHDDWTTRRGIHQGTVLVKASDFWDVRGYDEDFSGAYGHEDGHFLKKLGKHGLKRIVENQRIICYDKATGIRDATSNMEQKGRAENAALAKAKGSFTPEKMDVLRFAWGKIGEYKWNQSGVTDR